MSKTLFISLLFVLQGFYVFGQFHVYPKVGLNTSFTSISDTDYVNKAFNSGQSVFTIPGVGFSQGIRDRIVFKTELTMPPLGYKASLTSNYMGKNKWQNKFKETGYIRCQQLSFILQFESKPIYSKWAMYLNFGASVFFKSRRSEYSHTSNFVNSDPLTSIADTSFFHVDEYANSFLKPGLVAGLGIKRLSKEQNYLSIGLTYNQGFSTLSTTRVTYQADGQTFINHLLNNGTAIVLEATYGFALQKKYAAYQEKP